MGCTFHDLLDKRTAFWPSEGARFRKTDIFRLKLHKGEIGRYNQNIEQN